MVGTGVWMKMSSKESADVCAALSILVGNVWNTFPGRGVVLSGAVGAKGTVWNL